MLDDGSDGRMIRRRGATWRWALSVVVAAVLVVGLVAAVVRLDENRSALAVTVVAVTAALAVVAVARSWWEWRRISRHLDRTIDRLVGAESELRLLLDDQPDAVIVVGCVGADQRREREVGGADRSVGIGAGRPRFPRDGRVGAAG